MDAHLEPEPHPSTTTSICHPVRPEPVEGHPPTLTRAPSPNPATPATLSPCTTNATATITSAPPDTAPQCPHAAHRCKKRCGECSGRSANTYKTHSTWTTRVVSVEGVFVGDSSPSMPKQLVAKQILTVGATAGHARAKAGGPVSYSSEADSPGVAQHGLRHPP